jgi:hypothetical protein
MPYTNGDSPEVGDRVQHVHRAQTGTVKHVELKAHQTQGTDDIVNVEADGLPPLGMSLASEHRLLARPPRRSRPSMSFEIVHQGAEHRCRNGQMMDVIDHIFRVSDGHSSLNVSFGIVGTSYEPPEFVGPRPTAEELNRAAEAWLRIYLDERENLSRQANPPVPDMPGAAVEYWLKYGDLAKWS